jgi:hypothetical protein
MYMRYSVLYESIDRDYAHISGKSFCIFKQLPAEIDSGELYKM